MRGASFRINAALASALVALISHVDPADACAYHGGGPGAVALHPGSIDVAIAIQVAEEAGTLATEGSASPLASMVGYHRVVRQIERLRDLLAPAARAEVTPAFSLLLIESSLWSRLTPAGAGMALAIHTAGPERDEPVVLTSGVVLRAVLDGRLSTADAVHRGLIRVEAPIDAKLALFDLLAKAAAAR